MRLFDGFDRRSSDDQIGFVDVIEDDGLTGCHGALRVVEDNADAAAAALCRGWIGRVLRQRIEGRRRFLFTVPGHRQDPHGFCQVRHADPVGIAGG